MATAHGLTPASALSRVLARPLLPPLIAFAAGLALGAVVAVYGGDNPLDPDTWTSFDSGIYVQIAERGYDTWTCPQVEVEQGAKACGNVGWFPLYPALMAPLMAIGLSAVGAGMLVTLAFWLGLLIALWLGLLRPAGARGLLALALATFAPGAYYFHAVFPMAMTVFFLVCGLVALDRGRWWWAGAAGFLAAAAYPASAAFAGIAALWLLLVAPAPSRAERLRRVAVVSGMTLAGTAAVLLYAQVATGAWDGYFGVQARFHHGFHVPVENWLDLIRPRFEGLGNVAAFVAFQAWLTTALVVLVVAGTWRRRATASPLDWLLAIWALAFWLLPLTQATTAYYRTDALLVPIAVAFVREPPRLVAALVVVAAVVTAGGTLAFMQGVLV